MNLNSESLASSESGFRLSHAGCRAAAPRHSVRPSLTVKVTGKAIIMMAGISQGPSIGPDYHPGTGPMMVLFKF